MSLEHGGSIDPRLYALQVMEKFGWSEEQYMNRPLWFDVLYGIKCKAEAKYKEIQNQAS